MTEKIEVPARGDHAAIVVGVDGSPSGQDALDWAAAEASSMQRPLRLVHGFIWPLMGVHVGPSPVGPADGGLQAAAERVLVDAETRARLRAPEVKITTELVVGAAGQTLLAQANDAEMVVVGSRGLGGFSGLLVGSVGVALAAHAPCPVIVVHPRPTARPAARGVVVGVDGSDLSAPAIRFAFQAAARRGARLTAVRAWSAPGSIFPEVVVKRDERRLVLEALEVDQRLTPEVEVEVRLVGDHAGRVLVEESNNAELIVVGSRGRGGFQGLLLGSVSQAVLQHAECPVAVVRPHR